MLSSQGVSLSAVSNIEEASFLRKSGIEGEILILGFAPVECANDLLKCNIAQKLIDEEYAK